jgi:type II secretory pathway pseudopilin PulG
MKKGYSYFSNNDNKKRLDIKNQEGLTLVEVLIAFLVLVIVTLIMVQGVMIATKAAEINKAKTAAMAIASNEIEEIRLRNYGEIGIEGASAGEPEGGIEAETVIDGYTVSRTITWVEGEYSYKQVEISAINDSMNEEVTIVTQVYPSFGEGGPPSATYPPPANLIIEYDFGFWIFRVVGLNWDAPDTETPIDNYRVFRDGSYIGTSNMTRYVDWPGNSQNHTYYITVRYVGGTESERSNEVTTSR